MPGLLGARRSFVNLHSAQSPRQCPSTPQRIACVRGIQDRGNANSVIPVRKTCPPGACVRNFGTDWIGCGNWNPVWPKRDAVRCGVTEGAVQTAGDDLNINSAQGGNTSGDFQSWIMQFPFQRVGVWVFIAFVGYQMKDFFGIVMGTFIISAIGNSFVQSEEANAVFRFAASHVRRRILVAIYFALIVALVTLFGAVTIPDIVREGVDFVQRLQSDNIWVVVLEKMRAGLGDNIMEQVERFLLLASTDDIMGASEAIGQVWTAERTHQLGTALQKLMRGYTEAAVTMTSELLSFVTRFALQMFVSLVLSFMFVWDFPKIRDGIKSLKNSRLSAVYDELAPSLQVFGQLFGKALQAQARIAFVNTILTAIGLWALRIPNIGLLSLFVFICGFIPIAGVFISTSPMAFIALTEYGFLKLLAIVVMVTGVHFVEAYGLNPMIYSAHLKLHPLLVLSVLVVAEHSLGVWGLMLAVPLTVFALDYVIRFPGCSMPEVAAKELQTVLHDDTREWG